GVTAPAVQAILHSRSISRVERSPRARVKDKFTPFAFANSSMSRTNNHKLRIGFVGAGAIVRDRHLPGLTKHPEVEIIAVSNSTYESAEKFCQENAPHATPMANWADLLSVPELDI